MKKNKKWILPAVTILVIAAAVIIVSASAFLRSRSIRTLVNEQNYVSARLLSLGSYEEGRTLAAKTDQLSANTTSRELLVLADGFQENYEDGAERAEKYLENSDSEVLTTLQRIYEEFLAEAGEWNDQSDAEEPDEYTGEEELAALKEEVREQLVILLLEVQNSIDVTMDSETLQTMVTCLQEGAYSLTTEEIATLEEDDSLLASEVLSSAALVRGDYVTAFEAAQEVLDVTGSVEDRAAVANIAAAYSMYLGEDDTVTALAQERAELYSELNELESEADSQGTAMQSSLELQIEKVEAQIAELTLQIEQLPMQKAINYIETTTPAGDRTSASCLLELAQLYYLSGEEDTAEEYLAEVLLGNDGSDAMAQLVEEFVDAYKVQNGDGEGAQYSSSSTDPEDIWNRIASMLGFTGSYSAAASYNSYYYDGYYYGVSVSDSGSVSFYEYVTSFLYDNLYGITIRSIDATAFPDVTIAVNVSAQAEQTLTEENFSITELGVEIEDFTILNSDEMETGGDYSIVLVVDHSGSMENEGMEDDMFGRKKPEASADGPSTDAAEPTTEEMPQTTEQDGETGTVFEAISDDLGDENRSDIMEAMQEGNQTLTDSSEAAPQQDGAHGSADHQSAQKSRGLPAGLILTVLGILGLWFGFWLFGKTRGVRLLFTSVFAGRIARYYWIAILAGAVFLIIGVLLLRHAIRVRPAAAEKRKEISRGKRRQEKAEQGPGKTEGTEGKSARVQVQEKIDAGSCEDIQTDDPGDRAAGEEFRVPAAGQNPTENAQTEPDRVISNTRTSSPEPAARFCPQCGRSLAPGAKFCGGCGIRIG